MYFKIFNKIFKIRILIVFFFCSSVYAQKDTILLNETVILSTHLTDLQQESFKVIQLITKTEIEKASVQSIQELLEYVLNVDVRQRGEFGVQADISIRGGSFEQCLILLNGIKMNDPQTGHHSMNLPVDLQDIERIEILDGSASRIYGANAFSAAINIITIAKKENRLKLSSVIGENQLYATTASLSLATDKMQHYFSVGRKGSDGYINNTDFDISNLFYQNSLRLKKGSVNLQTGYNNKQFGANSFYSAKYPNQFEHTNVFFADVSYKTQGSYKFTSNIYYRRHQDKFELFRNNPPAWYTSHNYHLTQIFGAEAKLNFNSCIGKSLLGIDFRSENILSNVLGEVMKDTIAVPGEVSGKFTKSHHRENLGFYGEQSYKYRNFNISAGLFVNWNSDFDWKTNAGIDINYCISNSLMWYASVNQSMRMPTFTDLYYIGPTNLGNINLKPEEAIAYETGMKFYSSFININMAVFLRDGNNLIDWVRRNDTMKWESRNLTNIISRGFEFSTQMNMQKIIYNGFFINNLNLSYSYLDLEKNSNTYISYYALDYLKHKITASVDHKIYKKISGNWALSYQERMGSYTDITTGKETPYSAFLAVDTRITYKTENWNCYVEAANLFDKKYQDIGNIPMPGRWLRVGLNISLNLGKKPAKPNQDVLIENI
ncbi:MAG: TonB-dependent receptor plug domain-containing protein [Bacteroidales bacterium]